MRPATTFGSAVFNVSTRKFLSARSAATRSFFLMSSSATKASRGSQLERDGFDGVQPARAVVENLAGCVDPGGRVVESTTTSRESVAPWFRS